MTKKSIATIIILLVVFVGVGILAVNQARAKNRAVAWREMADVLKSDVTKEQKTVKVTELLSQLKKNRPIISMKLQLASADACEDAWDSIADEDGTVICDQGEGGDICAGVNAACTEYGDANETGAPWDSNSVWTP
ncbi:MAG: hypothetical protein HY397_03205 [Candidatus Doudnabacteria bacterium]|nr:hypothetical protein [Candidatus Doudnabacteria bacterium]